MLARPGELISAKIAAELNRAVEHRTRYGLAGQPQATPLSSGSGWRVDDVICTSGPGDHVFEEQHAAVSIALVIAGSFQYRVAHAPVTLSPGAVFLGNPGACFECGHHHAAGDRCVAFSFTPEFFARLTADAGLTPSDRTFRVPRLPPLRDTTQFAAQSMAALAQDTPICWEELAVDVAASVACLAAASPPTPSTQPQRAVARVTATLRELESRPAAPWSLNALAAAADLSPFHYLRTFRRLTGITPHQFVLRMRMREAAARLISTDETILTIALSAGFEDLSAFNRTFRMEFGATPREFRRRQRPHA